MYKSDELIYIQMHKTGCTHITSILDTIFNGEHLAKHSRAKAKDIKSNRFFLSSIRNPWDWYLSLWTYGVQGNGGLRNKLTERNISKSFKSAIVNPVRNLSAPFKEPFRDIIQWRNVYESDNVHNFRRWLELIHLPSNSGIIGEGYDDTEIADFAGFMTHRYIFLCCKRLNKHNFNGDFKNLEEFDEKNCYIDHFVRQEYLEKDLCNGLEKVLNLTQYTKSSIYNKKKTNTSKRLLEIGDYYDQKSIDIVSKRDKLIINKFNYLPPRPK
jgi:hypothetical protein